MNPKFSIDRLVRALKRETKNKLPADGRYYHWTAPHGRVYAMLQRPEVLERALKCPDFGRGETYEMMDNDLDAALKSNDWEREQNVRLLIKVAEHVANGHYNDAIVERLRKIAEIEQLHDAEAILASAPPRSVCGAIESWCMSALQVFGESEFHRLDSRRRILQQFGKG